MTCDESKFLIPLFAGLDNAGLTYAVLRNAETLPKSLDGSDIDMQIAIGSLEAVVCCLRETAVSCGGGIVAKVKSPHFMQLQFMGQKDGVWWGCCIDLFEGVFCQSVLPVAGDGLLKKRILNANGIWTLDIERGMYLGFVKELVTNGVYAVKYADGAKRAVAEGKDDFLLSEPLRNFVRKSLFGKFRGAKVFCLAWLFSITIRHPVVFCKNWLGFHFSRVIRFFRSAGGMIVVMGADGAGKTTILNEIRPLLKIVTHGNITIHHLRPGLLAPLGRLRGGKYEPGNVCTNPHGSKSSGFIGSMLRFTYLMCDYVIGYWVKVKPRLMRVPAGLWIFDRYAYDIFVDPKRFRIALPSWMIKLSFVLAPKPDLLICLGGDPKLLYARKPETSQTEVARQCDVLKGVASRFGRAVWIETTKELESSVTEVLEAILENRSI